MTPLLTRARSRTDRFLQIADVFIRHGLGFLVEGLGAPIAGPLHRVRRTETGERLTHPQHLRMALEELGPTFIKVGQLVSTRQDLLPPAYTRELAKLQDDSSQIPFAELVNALSGQPEEAMPEQLLSAMPSNGTSKAAPPMLRKHSSPMMPPFMVSAPGKVIVYGEHAVVHGKVPMP